MSPIRIGGVLNDDFVKVLSFEFLVGAKHCEVCSGLEYVLNKNNYYTMSYLFFYAEVFC